MDLNDSILVTIKKMIGPGEGEDYFDPDLIIHINSALATLRQLGIGPQEGFQVITGEETWTEFIGDNQKDYEMVKSYIYLRVKVIFDPPSSSAVLAAYQDTIKEYEWRSCVEPEIRHL